jgi:hypothetical protein
MFQAGASPVHSGLLHRQEYDAGGLWTANQSGFGYALSLGDGGNVGNNPYVFTLPQTSVFYTLESKRLPRGVAFDAVPLDTGFMAWNPRLGPPERGTSARTGYWDTGNGILDAADVVDVPDSSSCSGPPAGSCTVNLRFFLRGAPNPNFAEAGSELYSIAGNGDSYVDLDLPAGFFDTQPDLTDCTFQTGLPSEPFVGRVPFQGGTAANDLSIEPVHLVVRRTAELQFGGAPVPVEVLTLWAEALVPIEVRRGATLE